eukprot:6213370-Pleurochrysis_carterae.AAC.1
MKGHRKLTRQSPRKRPLPNELAVIEIHVKQIHHPAIQPGGQQGNSARTGMRASMTALMCGLEVGEILLAGVSLASSAQLLKLGDKRSTLGVRVGVAVGAAVAWPNIAVYGLMCSNGALLHACATFTRSTSQL